MQGLLFMALDFYYSWNQLVVSCSMSWPFCAQGGPVCANSSRTVACVLCGAFARTASKKKGPLLRVLMCARRESCERRIGIPVGVHTVKTPAWLQLAACPRRCAQATYARHWTSIAPGISWWCAAACLGRCAREAGIVLACRCEQTPAASLEPWLRRKRARMHE